MIPAATAALVTLNVEHIELADEVAEDDGAFTGHAATTFPSEGACACKIFATSSSVKLVTQPFLDAA